jgi:AAA+ ATPase superfamily predicted ATPase
MRIIDKDSGMIAGRAVELKHLQGLVKSAKAELLVVYGRRRIGKSALIRAFCEKRHALLFEALEGEGTQKQIMHFTSQLREQIRDPLLGGIEFKDWDGVLAYLTTYLASNKNKCILFFDEFQWQAASQGKLISLLKYYWDNHWKAHRPLLILCGSIGSFMVRKVLRSKALYGRVTSEIHLRGLDLSAAKVMLLGLRSHEEILLYLMTFGGVPKYLEEVDTSFSFHQNIDRLCFSPQGVMVNELDRIFASQFREASVYKRIVKYLLIRPQSLEEIAEHLKISSGGGLKQYMDNLILADMVEAVVPLGKAENTKIKRYRVCDEFLVFFAKFMEPHLKLIRAGAGRTPFQRLTGPQWKPWSGLAFERFCVRNATKLAQIMGFEDQLLEFGPIYERATPGFQVDLAFRRNDKVMTVCEIKYFDKPIDSSIIASMQRRCELVKLPRGWMIERALISVHGPDKALRASNYFHHYVRLDDFLE